LELLNDDNWLRIIDSTHPSKAVKPKAVKRYETKAVERAYKGMLPLNRRTPESARAAERPGGTKSEVG